MPSNTASTSASSQWASLTFVEVLEDLSSRFIVNLPSEELQRIERICFQVEQAHWFYEDFLRPLNSTLPSLNLRKFSIYILQTASLTVPLIRQYISSGSDAGENPVVQLEDLGGATFGLEAAFDEFLKYKTRVPVCGAVLLSEDWKSCLLVKGWKSSASWGFPKGKINQSEAPRDCAIRETFEETGYDCTHLLKPDSKDWMELNVREQSIRLYIVPNVSKDTDFETKTRKEISKIAWFKLSDLPTWKQSKAGGGGGLSSANAGSKFYLVTPFIGKLKHWISENKKRVLSEQRHPVVSVSGGCQDPTSGQPATSRPIDDESPSESHNMQPPGSSENDQSAALLAMLKGSMSLTESASTPPHPLKALEHTQAPLAQHFAHPEHRNTSTSSPLPAPRAQKSSNQTLKLLEMLSPNSPQLLKTAPGAVEAAQPALANSESIQDAERKRKRELLLQQLLNGAQQPSETLNATVQSSSPQSSQQLGSQQEALLSLMNGASQVAQPHSAYSQVSSVATRHPASMAHQHTAPQPAPVHSLPSSHFSRQGGPVDPPAPETSGANGDAGRNALLDMLNAGPRQLSAPLSGSSALSPNPNHAHPPQSYPIAPGASGSQFGHQMQPLFAPTVAPSGTFARPHFDHVADLQGSAHQHFSPMQGLASPPHPAYTSPAAAGAPPPPPPPFYGFAAPGSQHGIPPPFPPQQLAHSHPHHLQHPLASSSQAGPVTGMPSPFTASSSAPPPPPPAAGSHPANGLLALLNGRQ
ncbi:unnamed protein product [Parajaminaea phylloscopi]